MRMYDEIYKNLERILCKLSEAQKGKLIIYPFEESGYFLKRILNQDFKIKECGILDDTLFGINPDKFFGFDSIDFTQDYVYLVASESMKVETELFVNGVTFDRIFRCYGESRVRRTYEAMDKLIADYDFETVLDVGSGEGIHSEEFLRAGKDVTAIDYGESDYFRRNRNRVKTIIADINEYDFGETQFDCIWCAHVLEHQLNPHAFLKKIFSLLKEGGILAITVPPQKDMIVGGHVSLWNGGVLLYHLVLAGFDCHEAAIKKYGYNISVIVKKRSVNVMQKLTFDTGDIKIIREFLPDDLEYSPTSTDTPFNGDIVSVGWD